MILSSIQMIPSLFLFIQPRIRIPHHCTTSLLMLPIKHEVFRLFGQQSKPVHLKKPLSAHRILQENQTPRYQLILTLFLISKNPWPTLPPRQPLPKHRPRATLYRVGAPSPRNYLSQSFQSLRPLKHLLRD